MEEVKRTRKKVTDVQEQEQPVNSDLSITMEVSTDTIPEPIIEEVLPIEEQLIEWKKVGTGFFYLGNRIIKPGQVFKARMKDIPQAFRDVIVPVNEIPVIAFPNNVKDTKSYTLSKRQDGLYDILDKHHKKVNENPLKEIDAKNLVNAL